MFSIGDDPSHGPDIVGQMQSLHFPTHTQSKDIQTQQQHLSILGPVICLEKALFSGLS